MSFNALGDIESSIPVSPLHLAVSVTHEVTSGCNLPVIRLNAKLWLTLICFPRLTEATGRLCECSRKLQPMWTCRMLLVVLCSTWLHRKAMLAVWRSFWLREPPVFSMTTLSCGLQFMLQVLLLTDSTCFLIVTLNIKLYSLVFTSCQWSLRLLEDDDRLWRGGRSDQRDWQIWPVSLFSSETWPDLKCLNAVS